MRARDDLHSAIEDARMLDAHGFDGWPNADELTRKICDVEDGLMSLANALGLVLIKDCRNRWSVARKSEGGRADGC